MKYKIGMILISIGYVLAAIGAISGFGYTLYNWGSVGMELGPSAWAGFILFAKMVLGGIVTVMIGFSIL